MITNNNNIRSTKNNKDITLSILYRFIRLRMKRANETIGQLEKPCFEKTRLMFWMHSLSPLDFNFECSPATFQFRVLAYYVRSCIYRTTFLGPQMETTKNLEFPNTLLLPLKLDESLQPRKIFQPQFFPISENVRVSLIFYIGNSRNCNL